MPCLGSDIRNDHAVGPCRRILVGVRLTAEGDHVELATCLIGDGAKCFDDASELVWSSPANDRLRVFDDETKTPTLCRTPYNNGRSTLSIGPERIWVNVDLAKTSLEVDGVFGEKLFTDLNGLLETVE
jgi:hypothetical protein